MPWPLFTPHRSTRPSSASFEQGHPAALLGRLGHGVDHALDLVAFPEVGVGIGLAGDRVEQVRGLGGLEIVEAQAMLPRRCP
jgi:hypothetical protein